MKKVVEYDLVRRMFFREKLSQHEISRQTGLHRETIKKMVEYPAPPGYRMKKPRVKRKLQPFIPVIDKILEDDKKAPRKQRHTALKIYQRLRDEHGFSGKYTIVKDYVRDKKISSREVYFPLLQEMGTSQTDFGKARLIIAGVEQDAHFFCMGLVYSDAVFVRACPTEGFEAVADGHNFAYKFFEGVPPLNLYDNMSTAVKGFYQDHGRELTDSFLELRSHYLFESRFCNVGRPNEKGVVENLVGYVRRNFLVPVLSFPSWEALNAYLEEQCRKRLLERAAGKDKTIGQLLQEERSTFLPIPGAEFDACRTEGRRVSSLSLVQYKTNNYSVPVEYAYREVMVKAYVFHVEICHKDRVIACHERSYLRGDFIFDPLHYLPLLRQKPGALDGAKPFSDWDLPDCFHTLRRYLEGMHGRDGKREYIKILQLLRKFSLSELRRGIEKAFEHSCLNFDAIRMLTRCGREPVVITMRLSQEKLQALPRVQVDLIDTACYAALLQGGVS